MELTRLQKLRRVLYRLFEVRANRLNSCSLPGGAALTRPTNRPTDR